MQSRIAALGVTLTTAGALCFSRSWHRTCWATGAFLSAKFNGTRQHADTHKTRDGLTIKQDCDSCHSIE
jgi:hypothetical protein